MKVRRLHFSDSSICTNVHIIKPAMWTGRIHRETVQRT